MGLAGSLPWELLHTHSATTQKQEFRSTQYALRPLMGMGMGMNGKLLLQLFLTSSVPCKLWSSWLITSEHSLQVQHEPHCVWAVVCVSPFISPTLPQTLGTVAVALRILLWGSLQPHRKSLMEKWEILILLWDVQQKLLIQVNYPKLLTGTQHHPLDNQLEQFVQAHPPSRVEQMQQMYWGCSTGGLAHVAASSLQSKQPAGDGTL